MPQKQSLKMSLWKKIIGFVFLFIAAGLIIFITAANITYYGSLPADLPCRDCTGDAQMVRINGFDLYYRELGSNNANVPIVILHGGPGHSSLSFKQSLDFLADQYRVIYYDQRGSGNSQIIPDSSLYTINQLVEELEAIRRDIIQSDQIVVIGHSSGGALAQHYALSYPQHVNRLVLISSIRMNNGVSSPLIWDRLFPALFIISGWPPTDSQARDNWFAQMNETSSAARLYNPASVDLLKDAGYLSFATWREVSRSLEGSDHSEELKELNIPALVMYGAADSAFTGEETATSLCALLRKCTLVRFERSGHWPFLEEPERFVQEMEAFLVSQ